MSGNEKIAVIVAGQMGTGIVHAFASAGFSVVLSDIRAESLEKAKATVRGILEAWVRLGKIAESVIGS